MFNLKSIEKSLSARVNKPIKGMSYKLRVLTIAQTQTSIDFLHVKSPYRH